MDLLLLLIILPPNIYVCRDNEFSIIKQGQKRPLDTPMRIIERRREREKKEEGEI